MCKLVKQTSITYLFLLLALVAVSLKHAPKVMASQFAENVHYVTLDHQASPDKQVKIFYTPYCRPCAIVHKPLQKMAEKVGLKFYDIPVDFGPLGKDIQASIAAASDQGHAENYVQRLITSIHFQPSTTPNSREELALMLEECGVDSEKFRQDCQELQQKTAYFDQVVEQYKITSTPTIIVNGNKQVLLGGLKSFAELESLLIELSQS
ncbi:disulfide bond formation protein DsbA [Vibrio panuliri]|uniref:Disulfide bond formation protein DsbA n=1 Tax=Vibrio panuliri TaxID=1381081 RepID=A0A1Q9HQH4_9VIBR|nr:DsbA family protein [Vibrio panuliri]OLQ93095.1 disulfide bond formation protein DsbA [Vibrio panuliri]